MSTEGIGANEGRSFLLRSLHEVSLTAPILTIMHGKLEHASHEDCAVAHASPIHGPGVNIMGVGAHDNIAECLVYGKCQIRVSV